MGKGRGYETRGMLAKEERGLFFSHPTTFLFFFFESPLLSFTHRQSPHCWYVSWRAWAPHETVCWWMIK